MEKQPIVLKNGTREPSNGVGSMWYDSSTRKVFVIADGYEYTFDNQDPYEFKKLKKILDDLSDKGADFGGDMIFTPHVKPRINLNVHHGIIYDDLNGLSNRNPDYWTLRINL